MDLDKYVNKIYFDNFLKKYCLSKSIKLNCEAIDVTGVYFTAYYFYDKSISNYSCSPLFFTSVKGRMKKAPKFVAYLYGEAS